MNPANEPVGWAGGVTALAVAAIPFFRSMGVHITQDQANSGLGLLAALIVLLTLLVRSKVTPTQKAQDKIDQAAAAPPGAPVPKA